MNSFESRNGFVENVETVEALFFQNMNGKNLLSQFSTKIKNTDVETVEIHDLITYFSTLSTRLKSVSVENQKQEKSFIISDLNNFPQIPQFPQEQKDQRMWIFQWLHTAIDEGHIEPSQPYVGRILGWPQFSLHKSALWSDFTLWCRKKELKQMHIADSDLFFAILNRVFERSGDRYEFPPITECRKKYFNLRKEYESITACE